MAAAEPHWGLLVLYIALMGGMVYAIFRLCWKL